MHRENMVRAALVLATLAWAPSASACGDKFLAPGRGPSLCALNKPPHEIAVLIYGDESSEAVSALSSPDYQKTLKMGGYKVFRCSGSDDCQRELRGKKFDVVLADAKDAKALKEQTGSNVVPVLLKASKEAVKEAKATYGQAFDAAGGGLRLLPVIKRAANTASSPR